MNEDCIDDNFWYRPNVGLVILNKENKVFAGKRLPANSNDKEDYGWQMPQGGTEFDPNIEEAMFRELEEETGIAQEHVEIIKQTKDWMFYEFSRLCTPKYME